MGLLVKLAIRNIFRQRKRSITLGINYLIVAFLLVLLLAFSSGAARNISSSIVKSSAGHITITGQFARDGKIYGGLLRVGDIIKAVKDTFGNKATTVVRYSIRSTVYANGLSKRLSFSGIDTESDTGLEAQSSFIAGSWADFAADPNGVAVPRAEAAYFGLSVGDTLVLSARTRFGAFNTGLLKVRAIYESGNYFAKSLLIAHFDFLKSVDLAEKDAATSVYVFFPSTRALGEKRNRLSVQLASMGFEVRIPKNDTEAIEAVSSASTKYEEDKEGRDRIMITLATLDEVLGIVKTVLAAINGVGAFIAIVMLFVIAVSIFINLRMSVNERMKEIGTMRVLGVEASSVTGLFVLESVILASLFSVGGALLAALIAVTVRFTFIFPATGDLALFLDNGHLALNPEIFSMVGVVAAISVFAAVFSFFPARRGGKIPPVDALSRVF